MCRKPTVVAGMLLLAVSAGACAESEYRCEDRAGDVTSRDTPCPVPPATVAPEQDPRGHVRHEVPAGTLGDWHTGEPIDRQPWTPKEPLTIARQVQARQQRLDELRAIQHAENRQR